MSNNIIDSIQLSGVTYQIQGSGGGITVDPTLDSGSTNPVANSAITTALGDKVNVVDNNVSAYTFENKIGGAVYVYSEHFAGPIYIRYTGSTSSSGDYYAGSMLYYSSEWGWEGTGLYFSLSNGQITATTVSSAYFDIEIENGEAVLTFKDGFYLRQYDSKNGFVALTKTAYESGQSADVIEDTVYDVFDKLNDKLDDKQDTLVSSQNIKTINNQSLLGSGNIDIQGGGGKAIEAGRGISITTGETADTVSFNLPISAGTGTDSVAEGKGTTARGYSSHAEGDYTTANGLYSHAEGSDTYALGESSHSEGDSTIANGDYSHTEGWNTTAYNQSEHASGQYNNSVSASTTFGNSGNTLFSVGNGTAENARHNAFEVRQNGDIYISSGNTDIKLQDHLGGGTQTIELTQAQYDALTTKDPNTYYIITDAQAGDLTNYYTKSETNTLLGGKADTATTYTKTEVDTALGGKQATLISGINVKTINNESILGSGNIDIQGGSDINVVQTTGTSTTDVMSQNAVTTQLNGKADKTTAARGLGYGNNNTYSLIYLTNQNNQQISGYWYTLSLSKINGKEIVGQGGNNPNTFSLVETSAITTSVTSSSTDAQVPSAKAVNDKLGGLSLVKLTQAEYDALATKDSNTLYVIVN